MTEPAVYVHGSDRMLTAARILPNGIWVRFADEREGVIPYDALELREPPLQVSIPRTDHLRIRGADGNVEDVPWDFARHYAEESYRARSEAIAATGRRSVGHRLKALRESQGVTQEQLAEASGVHRVTIARLESGDKLPRFSTLEALASALHVTLGELLSG